jgi:hypothetical protein
VTLTINDTNMTSDRTVHTARPAPGRQNQWEVSWLPGQPLDRNTAITAMVLADTTADQDLHEGHRLWPHIQGWAEELGLTAPDAITRISQPPADRNCEQELPAGSRTAKQPTEQELRHRNQRSSSASSSRRLPRSEKHRMTDV